MGFLEGNKSSPFAPGFPVTHNDVENNNVLSAFDCYLVERLLVF